MNYTAADFMTAAGRIRNMIPTDNAPGFMYNERTTIATLYEDMAQMPDDERHRTRLGTLHLLAPFTRMPAREEPAGPS